MKKADHTLQNYKVNDAARPPAERWVTMSNRLTRAAHGLNLGEKRIVAMAASRLDSRRYNTTGDTTTRITAEDYAALFKVDMDTAYTQLQSAAKQLYNRTITFYEPAHTRRGKPLPPTIVNMRWVGMVKYQKGEGWVELAWLPQLMPHLTGLKKQFTSYQLAQATALRSTYSWKLLELLMRFESTGWAEYTIEDFAVAMEATEKQRANFAQIRLKIIEPAVAELTQKDSWIIEWKPIKAGRKVTKVRFDFRRDPQQKLL